MSHPVMAAGAVVAGVLVTATAVLWLDRQGARAVLRTAAVAVAAALVTLASSLGGEDLVAGAGEAWATGVVLAGLWLAGLAAALGLAGLAGWTDLPLEGVLLGAVAGAAAGMASAPALGEAGGGVGVLQAAGLAALGAWVGGGASLAALQPSPLRRVGAGVGVGVGGWIASGALVAALLVGRDLLAGRAPLVVAGALAAAGAAAGAVRWGQRREARILLQELTEEVGWGTLPAAVVAAVAHLGSRWRRQWWPRSDERRWLAATLSELAIRKHRLRGAAGGASGLDGLHVGRIRARVRGCFAGGGGDPAEQD